MPPPVLGGGGRFFFSFFFRQWSTLSRFWWKGGFCFTFRSWWWGWLPVIRNPQGGTRTSGVSCHWCLIKAQAAARVGPAGLSSDFAKKRELDVRPSCLEMELLRAPPFLAYAQLS